MRTNLVLVAALALAGCASVGTPSGNDASIVAGTSTREDVAAVAGKPMADRGTESVYEYRDVWGYKSQLDVTYDEGGVVRSTFTERMDDN